MNQDVLTSTPARFCTGCLLEISNELQPKCNVNMSNLNYLEIFCLDRDPVRNICEGENIGKNSIHIYLVNIQQST
jgi:hypothetical protein